MGRAATLMLHSFDLEPATSSSYFLMRRVSRKELFDAMLDDLLPAKTNQWPSTASENEIIDPGEP
jgi:hypothetical protein